MSNDTNTWTVYKLTSPTNRVYIGCTELPIWKRFQNGRGYKANSELFNDIVQYGWNNFHHEIIAEYPGEEDARAREHLEIKKYPDGYNRYRGIKGYVPTGRPRTPSKKVRCRETGVIYDSIKEAARQTGLAHNKISYCCRGVRNKTGNYHWEFIE